MDYYGIRKYTTQKLIHLGGEGEIYSIINCPNKLLKIFNDNAIKDDLEDKLKYMIAHPLDNSIMDYLAWPTDIVKDSNGKFCGYIMPKLNIDMNLKDVYAYNSTEPSLSYKQKITIAINICKMLEALHKSNIVFGDMNPTNISVSSKNGRVYFIDTSNYHFGGTSFRCNGCFPGYVAPELLKKFDKYPHSTYVSLPLPTFTFQSDYFELAIHIFRLLNNGFHPYNGIKKGEDSFNAIPANDNAIRKDLYCHNPEYKHSSLLVLPKLAFLESINDLFSRAFIEGRTNPKKRPTPLEWIKALEEYNKLLTPCIKNTTHYYLKSLSFCPLCIVNIQYFSNLESKGFTSGYTTKTTKVQKKKAPNKKKIKIGFTLFGKEKQHDRNNKRRH